MANIQFFTLGGRDWSPNIDIQNFEVNQQVQAKEWQDANYRYHREDQRTRITGSFSIGFYKAADFAAWQQAMQGRQQGYYSASVHVNNLGQVESSDFFISAPLTVKRDELNGRFWASGTVTIEEC